MAKRFQHEWAQENTLTALTESGDGRDVSVKRRRRHLFVRSSLPFVRSPSPSVLLFPCVPVLLVSLHFASSAPSSSRSSQIVFLAIHAAWQHPRRRALQARRRTTTTGRSVSCSARNDEPFDTRAQSLGTLRSRLLNSPRRKSSIVIWLAIGALNGGCCRSWLFSGV